MIVSYIVFCGVLLFSFLLYLIIDTILFTQGEQNDPEILTSIEFDEDGELSHLDIIQKLNGWVELLDDSLRVTQIYGAKLTEPMAYSAETLNRLLMTDAGKAFYVYYGETAGQQYLICYPKSSYHVIYSLDHGIILQTTGGKFTLVAFLLTFVGNSLLMSLYLTKKIKKPIDRLACQMNTISNMESLANIDLPPFSEPVDREFQGMQASFYKMVRALQAQQEENDALQRNRNKMLLDLSHDIKTPVATIKSAAYALREGVVDERELGKYYDMIALKADRVNALSDDMFTMLKLESADYRLNMEKTDASELARRVAAGLYMEIANTGFHFAIEIPEREIMLSADQILLTRVLENLLTNAEKYNVSGKTIGFALRESPGAVLFYVRDDGDAIREEIRDTMFQAFIRGEASRSSRGGTGLGLSIARAIVERHNGSLSYHRENGENVFCVMLPSGDESQCQDADGSVVNQRQDNRQSPQICSERSCTVELRIKNLKKQFDKKIVLNNTGFGFQKGLIYSILGRNGAGKTTLFRCISGDLDFEEGEVALVENGASRPLTFEDVGIVSASPVLPDFLTGYEFIHFFVKLNREQEILSDIDSYFDLVRIEEEDRHKLIKNYSYGMKNKLQLMCCLLRNPKVILLDEPLSSFDIIVSHDIKELLLRMKDGHIILMATHIMQLAQDMSDEIVLLREGMLETAGRLDLQGADFEDYIIQALQEKIN